MSATFIEKIVKKDMRCFQVTFNYKNNDITTSLHMHL